MCIPARWPAPTEEGRVGASGQGTSDGPYIYPSTARALPAGAWPRGFWPIGVFFLCVLVGAVAFAAGGFLGLIEVVRKLAEPRTYETHPTYIYSPPGGKRTRGGCRTIFEGQNRKTASLSEMPPHLLDAVVAKEDERFREHGGVDLWGIMRALWVDIRAGEAVEGASTITQQYVRNAYLSQDRSISRKIKEALIAIEVERKQDSKDQIIADYLIRLLRNNATGGRGRRNLLHKSVEDLSIAESATLVGSVVSVVLGEDRDGRGISETRADEMFDTGYVPSREYNQSPRSHCPRLARQHADQVGVNRTRAHPRLRAVHARQLIRRYV